MMKLHTVRIAAGIALFVLCVASYAIVHSILAADNVYYVSTAGSDSYPGTESEPWATIQHAATVAVAGDTVNILPGTYNETVTPVHSGTQAQPITFQRHGEGSVTIVGQDWSTVIIDSKNLVIFDGITVNGNGGLVGIVLRNASFNTIRNCDVSNAEIAIHAYAGSSDAVEVGVSSIGNSFLNNTVHDTIGTRYREGIYIKNYMPYGATVSYTRDTTIEGNTIYNVWEAIQNTGGTWNASGTTVEYLDSSISPDGTTIKDNIIYNSGCESGIISGRGSNYLVEGNYIHDNGGNGSDCAVHAGYGDNIVIKNNVLSNNNGTDSYYGYIRVAEAVGEISNNTIVGSTNRGLYIVFNNAPLDSLLVKNNVFANITNGQIVTHGDMSTLTVKYNVFGKTDTTLGTNYIIANPQFDANFIPAAGSPVCTAGEFGVFAGAKECAVSTPTPTATATASPTATVTATTTVIATPTVSYTATPSLTPTATASVAPTPVPTALPLTLKNVYFTFGKLLYGRYASPSTLRRGDYIYLKNYDPRKIKLLSISLYDYIKDGNQCYSRTWRTSTSMYMKTCGLLPTKRKYTFIFKFQDIQTGVIVKKHFVVNTISAGTITK
jgi:hypothetical protein